MQWLRDGLKLIKSSVEVAELAKSVPDSGGVVVVPAFVGSLGLAVVSTVVARSSR
jgi:glycerol kinase